MSRPGRTADGAAATAVDWADPGYFSGRSAVGNAGRVLIQLIHPPRGHRNLPTRSGYILIAVTIGVGTAAFNTGQNILYLGLSMLLSTLLVSGMLSWFNFKGCRWRLVAGRHFRAGEPSPVHVEVENGKRRLPTYDLHFSVSAAAGGLRAELPLNGRLDPGAVARLAWEFTPARRGRERIRIDGLVSCYPFGFLRKAIRDSCEREIVVWPERVAYRFSGDKAGRRWMYGHHRRKGEGVELIHLRGYRGGDPLRRIHWKASARMGALLVRETEQEHHQAFTLLVDPSPKLWTSAPQFERMCAFAGSLAEDLYQRDQLRAVHVVGHGGRRIGGIGDLYGFLDTLALLERAAPRENQARPGATAPPGAVRFLPGPDGAVLARLEEHHAGEA
jgi:uncharacterized protein (DUF58 family)